MTTALRISCDEAGHTGPDDLLHRDQRFFGFGSVSVDDAEAWNSQTQGAGHSTCLLLRFEVRCDVSKPLQATVSRFTGDESDPGIKRARLMGRTEALGWRLVSPISFADSRDHPAVRMADIIAGVAVARLTNGVPEGFADSIERMNHHILPDSILPDLEVMQQRILAVNYLMLYDLAQRAERGLDPYADLADMYRAAEVSWVREEFRPMRG